MKKFDELLPVARKLGSAWDTEWAEENADRYDDFADVCEAAYDAGEITGKEFNELICTGLYDYDNLKEVEYD